MKVEKVGGGGDNSEAATCKEILQVQVGAECPTPCASSNDGII